MDNFRLIYKLLTVYKEALWKEGIPNGAIEPMNLGTTETHVRNVLVVLRNAGLIVGTNGQTVITLAGLEYLDKNEIMRTMASEHRPYNY